MTAIRTIDGDAVHTPADIEVRKADASDIDGLAGVLARAFDEDPVVTWFLREDAGRADAFQTFFAMAVRALTLPHDEVYTTADHLGAALWAPPGSWELGPDEVEELLPDLEAVFGPDKLDRSLRGMEAMDAHHPDEPHFYLLFLGVEPAMHSRGIGSALLRTVLRRCDEAGLPAYLEATSPRNVALYERHGFVVTDTLPLPDGGPPLWPMWRSVEGSTTSPTQTGSTR